MKKQIEILILIAVILAFTALGYFAGYQTARRSAPETPSEPYAREATTFYAEIIAIENSSFLVKGLSINDINYRGEFRCNIKENTFLVWRSTPLEFSDFEVGDLVSVTFVGRVLESDPAIPVEIFSVQLLADEKN